MHFWDRMLDDGGELRRALDPLLDAADVSLSVCLCAYQSAPFASVSVLGGAREIERWDRDKRDRVWMQALEIHAKMVATLPDSWTVHITC